MKVFGITGGVGMGKSTSGEFLRSRGLPVVDTDLLARSLVEPGKPALAEIRRAFGDGIISTAGSLRRDELARRVFSEPAARTRLEAILHPRIRELWRSQVSAWAKQSYSVAIVIIPLLFETSAQSELDATICVACASFTQRHRLLERGWSEQEVEQRIQAQWAIDKKIAAADYVIWTEGGLDVHREQLQRVIKV